MSYALLQQATDGLKTSNKALTNRLLASTETAKQLQLDSVKALEAIRANQTTLAPYIPDTEAEQTAAETAQTNAQASQTTAESAQATAEAQPALATPERDRAVAAEQAARLTALGSANDGLTSVYDEHIRPSLVLDFAKGDYWKRGTYPWNKVTLDPATDLTFSRASTATYFDANGVLQEAAIDEMRIDHDPYTGECLGVLIEPARTNRLPYSTAADLFPDKATSMMALAPDGSQVPFLDVSNDYALYTLLDPGTDVGKTFSTGVWLKANRPVTVGLRNTGEGSNTQINLDERWRWFSATGSIDETTAAWGKFGIDARLSGDDVKVAMFGCQVEEGPYPTSYIPTNGAPVTRSEETLEFQSASTFLDNAGTILWGATPTHDPKFKASAFSLSSGQINHAYTMFVDWSSSTDNSIGFTVEAGYRQGYKRFTPLSKDEKFVMGVSYAKGEVITATRGESLDLIVSANPVGLQELSFPRYVALHHRRVTYYPHALSAKDLEALTLPEADV